MAKHRILFSKVLWIVLTAFFVLMFATMIVGMNVAERNSGAINSYFGLKDYKLVETDAGRTAASEYYKSDYVLPGKTYLADYDVENKGNNLTGYYDNDKLYEENSALCEVVEEEGAALLWNDGALPLQSGSKVNMFSYTSVDYIVSGTGSGVIDASTAPTSKAAFERAGLDVNETLWDFYTEVGPNYKRTQLNGDGGASLPQLKANDVPWSELQSRGVLDSVNGGAAVLFIGRRGGEEADLAYDSVGTDGIDGNYLQLTEREKEMIEQLAALRDAGRVDSVIVLLNTGNPMQMNLLYGELRGMIDACMYIGQTGGTGMNGVADLLAGNSVPSGRVSDTWRYDNLTDPSLVNFGDFEYSNASSYKGATSQQTKYTVYAEGIYVGYRYYETRYEDYVLGRGNAGNYSYTDTVAFPFGYGISYADFSYSGFNVVYDENSRQYTVTVTVTNDADSGYSGREAVQIYAQKPYTAHDASAGVEKPAVELVGFAKTGVIDPGKSETVTITVSEYELKTYDETADGGKGTYTMEAGDYYLTAASDAHCAVNNILAAKGNTPENTDGRMDAAGDAAMTYCRTLHEDDDETWSVSIYDGKTEIYNRFGFADLNKYEHSSTKVTYLSRDDWTGTYPSAAKVSLTDGLFEDLGWDKEFEEDPDARNPVYGAPLTYRLVEMKGLSYNAEEWEAFLDQMTFKQQAELIANGFRQTIGINNLAVPATRSYDGPMGISAFAQASGFRTTGWPCLPIQAGTFDAELIRELGEGFGEDMLHIDVQGVYGPAANIHRNPYGGRNFEYYSEDPYLSGIMCRETVLGIQSKGGVVNTKHFVVNDQETNRHGVSVWINEQALREIYLKAFEYQAAGTETENGAFGMMSSYNRLGALWTGACAPLLKDVARGEWGFEGYFLTDYASGDMYSCIDGLLAGTNCWLFNNPDTVFDGYQYSPTVKQAMREASHRILYAAVINSNAMNGIDRNTDIVFVRVWWENAILACIIVFGILALASGVMMIISIIRGRKLKNNMYEQNRKNSEKGGNDENDNT